MLLSSNELATVNLTTNCNLFSGCSGTRLKASSGLASQQKD